MEVSVSYFLCVFVAAGAALLSGPLQGEAALFSGFL
jgi:hypothetical protein